VEIKDIIFDIIRKKEKIAAPAGKKGFFAGGPALFTRRDAVRTQLVTEETVRNWIKEGRRRVSLKRGAIITPLARELAGEKNLEVHFD